MSKQDNNNKNIKQEEIKEENIINWEQKHQEEKEKFLLIIADYENKMKRVQIDAQNYINKTIEKIILELIPLIDDLNSAIQISSLEVKNGLEMMLNNLKKTLNMHGIIEIIPKENEEFNIEIHQAINSEGIDFEKAKIKQVFKNGYKFQNKIIKPAIVILQ